ncbi:SpoIIE family protein phosphatase [Sphaerisporangium perillae]|uniref:SpoIIE family protein phosphatase n=1 Tax=Sphaerisporangium perillae TaxID=2935860 RepID=UPI0020102C51|nr:SpoIIE family protein phosphatase [Sphaerisporangium perillae]
MLAQAVRDTGAHIGAIYLLAEATQVLLMDTEIGLPAQIVKPWTRVRMNVSAPVAAAVRQRHLIWVPSHQELASRFPRTALSLPYPFATAAAPVQTGSRVWGSLVLLWPVSHPSELAPSELEVIDLACHKLGTLLQQAADSGHPLRSTGEPRVLAPAQTQEPDPQYALAAADYLNRLHEGCVALNLEGRITFASATAADVFGKNVAELLGKSLWEVAPWLQDPVFDDRCRAAVVSQQTTCCTARGPDGRKFEFCLYPDPSGISLRITPVVAGHPTQQHTHEPGLGSDGLPRADVFYNFLHMAAALTRALNVREVIDVVADHVMPVFKVQAMAIWISEGGKMRVIGSQGYDPDVLDLFDGLPLTSPTPAEHVLRTGEPAFFANWSELRQMYPYAVRYDQMAAWAYLPLAVSDDIVGACVLAFGQPHPFTAEERATLTALAGLMGQALDRVLLYDTKDRLAHSLQATLLPRSLPEIPGLKVAARYVPATRGVGIGGDFYDLIRLTDTSAAAVIGDVQGHNMTAAALMGQVRTAIHAHAVAGVSPGDVLRHTNRLLIDLDTDLFTSCLLIHFDLQLRTLCAANAGHPLPLMRPPKMPAEVIDVPAGLVLGIDPDADYPTVQAPFPPGAVVVLYTDGLVETPGTDLDNAIGDLADHLTRATYENLDQLSGTLLDYAPHTKHRADDIALLLLEHRANPG